MVGSYSDNEQGKCSSSAYIVCWNGLGWFQTAKLLAADGATNDAFGMSVAISSDVIVVGAPGDDVYNCAAYIFNQNVLG